MKSSFLRDFDREIQVVTNPFRDIAATKRNLDPACYVILLGGLRPASMSQDVSAARELFAEFTGAYVLSGADERLRTDINESTNYADIEFLESQINLLHVEFTNRSGYTFVFGGIPRKVTSWDVLKNAIEVSITDCFKINSIKRSWHNFYGGAFGYVVSHNSPSQEDKITYYRHSCATGTLSGKTNILRINQSGVIDLVWPK